jgi:16S rRNA (uracil1498-N3)-methyltransferase
VTLAFGPEGGWAESELKLFLSAGWIAASLGNTILRAETAAVAATAVALAELQ